MESGGRASSPDESDTRTASFRKPLNDAVNRRYRRHSPGGRGSDSSPSHGSPKLERSHSPCVSKEIHSKLTDGQHGRDVEGQFDRRSSRGHDSYRSTESQSHRNSFDFRRHDDRGRHHRHTDEDERYRRFSKLGHESRNSNHFKYSKNDRMSDRYRDNWRTGSSRSENVETQSRNYGRENFSKDHKIDERGKQANSNRGADKSSEKDYHRDREYYVNRKDHHRSPGSHGNDCRDEEAFGYRKGSSRGGEGGTRHVKETDVSNNKDYLGQEDQIQKRKRNKWKSDRSKDKYTTEREEEKYTEKKSLFDYRESDEKNENVDRISNWSDQLDPSSTRVKYASGNPVDEKPSSGFLQTKEVEEKVNTKAMSSTNNDAEGANSVDAAKVAALRAAELVNRKLVGVGGVGYLSTDQKKKLLWGSKKSSAAEESSNHWDLNLFSDKERQDKFNKLMSLRLPWCLWPLVGCEGQCCSREPTQSGRKCAGQETGRARDGFGEAVYGWAKAKRRSDRWSRIVTEPTIFASQLKRRNMDVDKLHMLPFDCGRCFLLNCLNLFMVTSLDTNEMVLSFEHTTTSKT